MVDFVFGFLAMTVSQSALLNLFITSDASIDSTVLFSPFGASDHILSQNQLTFL